MATTTTLLLKTASTIILAINTLSLLTGTTMLGGSKIFPPKTPATALAESQIRYTAGTTAALGAIGWWAASDLQERRVPIAMAAVGILVGALGRAVAGYRHGFGEGMWVAMWAEVAIPVGVWGVGRWEGVW